MNRFNRIVAAAAALSTLALACAGNGVDPSQGYVPTTRAPTTTTTVRAALEREIVVGVATAGAPRTLNPLLDTPDTAVLDVIGPAVFASAYDIDPTTYELVPDAIASIPSIENGGIQPSGDGTVTVSYRVAPGAVWADGVAITGDDLLFTYELITDRSLPIRPDLQDLYGTIVPGSMIAEGTSVTFRASPGPRLDRLFEIIVPRHAVEGTDFVEDWNERLWVAGGPFGFASYEPGQFLELKANPNYWKDRTGALPELDRVVFRFFDVDGGAVDVRLLGGFETGAVDVMTITDAQSVQTRLEGLRDDGAEVVVGPGVEWLHLNFQFGPNNRNDETLNRHVEFRRAVAHAIDRQRLSELTGTPPVTSAVAQFLPEFDGPGWTIYESDVELVKGELFELEQQIDRDLFAGNGPRLVLSAERDDLAVAALAGEVVRMLDEAGIGGELQLEDEAILFGDTVDDGSWDVGAWSFAGGAGAADAVGFFGIFDPEGLPYVGSNFFRWGTIDSTVQGEATDRYAQLVDRLRSTADRAVLTQLLTEAEALLAEEVVFIPLVARRLDAVAWWAEELSGVVPNPRMPITWNIETWRRPER